MRNILFTFCFALLTYNLNAQIGIGTVTPHSSSILDLSATDKGFLVPRMTQAQRTGITSPATGLLVYQTDGTKGFYYYDGTVWEKISTGVGSGDNLGNHIATQNIQLNGNWLSNDGGSEGVYVDAVGNVGIGTSSPSQLLDVNGNGYFNGNVQVAGDGYFDKIGVGTTTPTVELHVVGSALISSLNSNGLVRSDISGNLFNIAFTGSTSDVLRGDGTFGPASVPAWGLIGNSGTIDGTNFIGTNDNVPLNFRVNGVKSGRIGVTGDGSTFLGYEAGLNDDYSANYNVAIGYMASRSTTTGNANTVVGSSALFSNTTGSLNTAIGNSALYSNVAGNNATAIGYGAMYYANDQATAYTNYNVAVGYEALRGSITPSANTGNSNTAVGYQSLFSNSSGNSNTATGHNALYANTTGNYNTATGHYALSSNTIGTQNTAIGYSALSANTTASQNVAIGSGALKTQSFNNGGTVWASDNVAVGFQSQNVVQPTSTSTGIQNVSVGNFSMLNTTTGAHNVAVGTAAMRSNTTGSYNTAIGDSALAINTVGNYNTMIGYLADMTSAGLSNATAIGYNAKVGTSNAIILGGTGPAAVNVGIGTTIPTFKMDIRGNTPKATTTLFANLFQVATNDGVPLGIQMGLKTDAIPANRYAHIGVDDGGTPRNLILQNNNGFVGVGTLIPATKLDVRFSTPKSTTAVYTNLFQIASNDASPLSVQIGIKTDFNSAIRYGGIRVDDAGTARPLVLQSNGGNVGIGTVSPSAVFHVLGSVRFESLAGGANGAFLRTDNFGNVSQVNFTGNASDVLRGDGTFGSAVGYAWGLTGNGGTVDGTNFIGTTDNVALNFKVNNVKSGRIENSTGSNLFLGYESGNTNTGTNNVFLGHRSGKQNSTGSNNTGVGAFTLFNNTTGSANTAVGNSALATNSGSNNVAVGHWALNANTTGNSNTAVGTQSMEFNTIGTNNAALGFQSLQNNTANNNSALGYASLRANTSGSNNTAVGDFALSSNITSNNNTAIGHWALKDNTAEGNTAIGSQALQSNTSGVNNSALGFQSLQNNTTGNRNIALGFQVLFNNLGGERNVGLGYQNLVSNVSGSEGTAIGYLSQQNINNTNTPFTNTNVSVGAFSLQGTSTPSNNTGLNNVAIGHSALTLFRQGSDNIAIGTEAMNDPAGVDANKNIAIGTQAMRNNSFLDDNIAIGYQALFKNDYSATFSSNNVAIGNYALNNNEPTSNSNGIENTSVGNYSLYNNTTGATNTAIGFEALRSNTTGAFNSAMGSDALYSNTTGSYNAALGFSALSVNATGSYNVGIGFNAGPNVNNLDNTIAIGKNAVVSTSNSAVIGGTGADAVNVGIGVTDPAYKLDIRGNSAKTVTNSYSHLFQVASSDPTTNVLTLRIGLKTDAIAANRYLGINAYDSGIGANLFLQGNSGGKIGFGTTSMLGTNRFQFGDGTYNPSISVNGSGSMAYGVEFYENGTFRTSLGYSSQPGQNWFFIYGFGNNIIRSKSGYTVVGEVGTAGFHSTLENTGSYAVNLTETNVSLTLDHTHHVVYRTSGTITLPAPSTCKGRVYIIVNRNTLSMMLGGGSQYRDLSGTLTNLISPNTSITIISDGTDWLRVQ